MSYTLLSSFCAQMGSTDAVTFFIFQKRGDLGFWYIYYTRLDSWDMLISRSSIVWMDTIFAVVLLRYVGNLNEYIIIIIIIIITRI